MEPSAFNPEDQNSNNASKLLVALERISEAFRVLLWDISKELSLSPIQIQILTFLKYHKEPLCKVSYLAIEFNMTKATISDSVRVLIKKDLAIKVTDPEDTRSFSLQLTKEGQNIANKAATFALPMQKAIETLSIQDQITTLNGLLKVVGNLQSTGIVTVQRMCITCQYHEQQNDTHFCHLLGQSLKQNEIRLDCPEHISKG